MQTFLFSILFSAVLLFQAVPLYAEEFLILFPYKSFIYEQNLTGFQSHFTGRDRAKEVFLNETDQETMQKIISSEGRPEEVTVIAFGPESLNFARQNFKNSKIIFSMVNSARVFDLEKGNICGYENVFPYKNYFKVIKEIKPEAKKVKTVYSSVQGEYEARGGEYQDLEYSLILQHKKVSSEDDFRREVLDFIKGADAFIITNDPIFNDKNFRMISEFCLENGILLLTSHLQLVEAGASIGIVPDYARLGELTAELANSSVSGKTECRFGPFLSYSGDILYINENYLRKSGFELSEGFRSKAETFRQISSGIELFNKQLYKSAQKTFENILKKGSNETASYYLKRTIEKMTYNETSKLTEEAEKLFKDRKFAQSRIICRKILTLNITHIQAKELFSKITAEESEQIRKEGEENARSGKPFAAIKKYKESLNIFPENRKARDGMETVRRNELKRFPEYFRTGLEYYQKRKYREAVDTFENILLLDPGHQNSLEYLRLSRLKYDAITNILNCSKNVQSGCRLLKSQ